MKSSTRLDSALFQLTPTRTRCDLVISANGKTEKLASGLLNPFLAHLKTAQEQMAKGGYSIILEPESDVAWFTKGTLERFVRFVSTPEVLERVYSLESEILQIEEAITIQGNSETALGTVEDSPEKKATEAAEAIRPSPEASDEKAIVLYKPGENPPETNGSTGNGGNSKVQLLKVLETRKTMLQKEQGMAFARAVAAGFEIDNISPLMSFSEAFGASRLRDACKRFKELWKKKHETGQWVEIEATEAMSNRADFTAMKASGIILSSVANAELSSESNGKSDEKSSLEHQTPQGHPEYFHGQFPHQMYPPWPIQSAPGTVPMFQPYPVPYYPNYPGPAQFYQQPYPPATDDLRFNPGPRMGQRRHSMEGLNGNNTESETLDAEEEEEFEKESSHKRSNRSGKKKPGVVVIRNLNYIASKGNQNRSDDEDGSESGSESEPPREPLKSAEADPTAPAGGHWEAFQNFLLRAPEEEKHSSDMFSSESKARSKARPGKTGGGGGDDGDPILYGGRDDGGLRNGVTDMKSMNGSNGRVLRRGSADEPVGSRRNGSNGDVDGQSDVFYSEINGKRVYRNSSNGDDFVVDRHSSGFTGSSSDVNGFERWSNKADGRSSNNMDNDSYIVSSRGQGGAESRRNIVDMGSELANQKADDHRGPVSYEPEELSMMPQRGADNGSAGYDVALDYEVEGVSGNKRKSKEGAVSSKEATKQGPKKLSDKGPRSRVVQDDRKKNVGPIRRGKPSSKLSPLEEARARAEKLRTFKADLQKMKKEKEAAEMKRLEALKMERQKRIAARGGGSGSGSGPTLPSPPIKKPVPVRSSSTSLRASKFSDSEPGSTSPLQRYHTRTGSIGSTDSQKLSRSASRLSRSAISLPAPKRETASASAGGSGGGGGSGSATARIRRLSEPRISNHPISSLRAKSKTPDSSEVKKLSAIVTYDKGKAATLPGLKIKTPMPPAPPKGSSVSSEAKKKRNEKSSSSIDADENPIVEKTVLVLESEISVLGANYDSVPAPVSKVEVDAVHGDRAITNPVVTSDTKKEIPIVSSIDKAEKPYQAPHARVSSLEDVCTENSDYGKEPQTSLEPTGLASFKAQVFDSRGLKLEKIPEVSEKVPAKESSSTKGFRRLLKFGRKSSGSGGERNPESDNASINGSDTDDNGMNTEVHTLKNLISQDETPTAEATPQKSSRNFSLLSPFRSSKSVEKK